MLRSLFSNIIMEIATITTNIISSFIHGGVSAMVMPSITPKITAVGITSSRGENLHWRFITWYR